MRDRESGMAASAAWPTKAVLPQSTPKPKYSGRNSARATRRVAGARAASPNSSRTLRLDTGRRGYPIQRAFLKMPFLPTYDQLRHLARLTFREGYPPW